MNLPSKELLSTVLECNVTKVRAINGELLYCEVDECVEKSINIYELMHMMKELASDKGYYIVQDTLGFTKISRLDFGSENKKFYEDDIYMPDRVFDCCEWILEQTNEPE